MFDIHKNILTIQEVKDFAKYLYSVHKVAFHPDDTFDVYISSNNEKLFSKEEIGILNIRMEECFDVCNKYDQDIYELMGNEKKILYEA